MGILMNGILGGFTGRVGNVVGYRCSQGYCIRQRPAKPMKAPTAAQLAQRAKFALTGRFVEQLRPLFSILPTKGKRQTAAFNQAFSQVIKKAVSGNNADYRIHYPAVKLTSGKLYKGCRHSVAIANGKLAFTWCMGKHNCITEGMVVVLAYNPVKEQWIYNLFAANTKNGGAALDVPCNFHGDAVETYLFFMSADRKAVSDSVYLGAAQVPVSSCLIN